MKGAVLYGPRDVRFEERDTPKIVESTDAMVRTSATCVCGSGLLGELIGTPEYMSPEQAFSAGAPPIDLRKVTLDEFLRRLREEEPAYRPRRSSTTSDSGQSAVSSWAIDSAGAEAATGSVCSSEATLEKSHPIRRPSANRSHSVRTPR